LEHSSQAIWGSDPSVLDALLAAGWADGRRFDSSVWVEALEEVGFELNPLALQIWSEFGALTIWELGSSFSAALTYVVNGDMGGSRAQRADWLV
jgi:hypothetical protein